MTPTERLQAARTAAHERRFDEALAGFIWFHHHALEQEPTQAGVRLSFALDSWAALAAVYPEALDALQTICHDKTALIMSGAGSLDLFRDVSAINDALLRGDETFLLFREVARRDPELARQCGDLALPAFGGTFDSAEPEPPLTSPVPGTKPDAKFAQGRPTHSILPSETRKASSFAS
ncbi:hypothetical protein BH11PSE8_BH11PSE8_26510 [soil metagenome]